MAEIQPTLDAIDEAIDGYVTWHGHSDDAMVWSAEEPKERPWVEHRPTWHSWNPGDPPMGVRLEPGAITHLSIGGVDVTHMVRSVSLNNREATFTPTGIVTAVPEPPSGGDVLTNLRAAYQRIADLDQPERTVVAGPDMAARIEDLGITVIESPLVPEGQVYVINQPTITGPMFSEPMSYNFDQDVATYRFGMRFVQPASFTYSGVFDASDPVIEDIARIFDVPPHMLGRSRARSKQLHRAYRHRCLARRRRSR